MPDHLVIDIAGDGSIQMNSQEMATCKINDIPVKVVILNNGYLGMVRQWQQFFHGRRYSATPIWSPDYVKLAEAYGIAGYRVEQGAQIAGAVEAALRDPGPALVEFVIEQEANVYPMIPPGASLSEFIESAPEPASA
jgi:acetolactate synthase I/II/III large subunit